MSRTKVTLKSLNLSTEQRLKNLKLEKYSLQLKKSRIERDIEMIQSAIDLIMEKDERQHKMF